MPRDFKGRALLCASIFATALSSAAEATVINETLMITSGEVIGGAFFPGDPIDRSVQGRLFGNEFSLPSAGGELTTAFQPFFRPGDTLNLSGQWQFATVTSTFRGFNYETDGTLRFTSAPVSVTGPGPYNSTFTVSGTLFSEFRGPLNGPLPCAAPPCNFQLAVQGGGTSSGSLSLNTDRSSPHFGQFELQHIDYSFNTAVVPEPSTAVLVLTGCMAAVVWRKRRLASARPSGGRRLKRRGSVLAALLASMLGLLAAQAHAVMIDINNGQFNIQGCDLPDCLSNYSMHGDGFALSTPFANATATGAIFGRPLSQETLNVLAFVDTRASLQYNGDRFSVSPSSSPGRLQVDAPIAFPAAPQNTATLTSIQAPFSLAAHIEAVSQSTDASVTFELTGGGVLSGVFGFAPEGTIFPANQFIFRSAVFNFEPNRHGAIPEPSAFLLLASGLMLLAIARYRGGRSLAS